MNEGRTIFAQLFDVFPKHEFNKCVRRYAGNRRVRGFSCHDQVLIRAIGVGSEVAFAPLHRSGRAELPHPALVLDKRQFILTGMDDKCA